eukprot:3382476-Rhodomonas_salina.2
MPAALGHVVLSLRVQMDDPEHHRLVAMLGLQSESFSRLAHERGREQPRHAERRALAQHALEKGHVLGRQRPATEGLGREGHGAGVAHSADDEELVDGAEDRAGVPHLLAVVAAERSVEHRAQLHPAASTRLELLPGRPEPLRCRWYLTQHLLLALERFPLQLLVELGPCLLRDAILLAVAFDKFGNRTKQVGLDFRALCGFVDGLE